MSAEGPIPTNSVEPGLTGATRIRTSPSRTVEYSQPTPGDPSSTGSVANADAAVENAWTSS